MRLRRGLVASGLTGSRVRAAAGSAATSPMSSHVSKLAAVNTCFWIMKIAATALGETGGDLVSMTLNLGYAVSVGLFFGLFLIFLVAQLVSKAYHPLIFWTVILLTATTGTAVSDFIDRTLGLGYVVGTLLLIALLLGVLGLWYLSERSLAVDQIRTHKAEVFYWMVDGDFGWRFWSRT